MGDTPLGGDVQGKADVMCQWTLLSRTHINAHRALSVGFQMIHPSDNTSSEKT